jgi:hypothetical protein
MSIGTRLFEMLKGIRPSSFIAEVSGHLPYETDEEIDDYFDERWDTLYRELSEAEELDGQIVIHRCVQVKDPLVYVDKIKGALPFSRYTGLGIYWTWDERSAECHDAYGSGYPIILTGLVDLDDIDLARTVVANMIPGSGEQEREITLRKGAPIRVISLFYEELKDPIRFDPPIKLEA